MTSFYLNVLVSGLLIGIVYALIALGLTIIFGVMRVVNFAHGEMVVIGMYAGVLDVDARRICHPGCSRFRQARYCSSSAIGCKS